MEVTSRKEGGYCGAGTFLAKANFIKKSKRVAEKHLLLFY